MALSMRKRGGKVTDTEPDTADENAPLHTWPDPAKPSAVLVPPLVREHRRLQRARRTALRIVAVAVTASVAAGGGAMWWTSGSVDERAQAQAELAAANAQIVKYQPLANYFDALTERRDALRSELADDISFSGVARTILETKPEAVGLTAFNVVPGAPCPGPDPFTSTDALGCLQINGEAGSPAMVGDFVDELNALPADTGIVGAFANSLSSTNGGRVGFSISANYTDAVLSYRFVPEGTNPDGTVAPPSDAGVIPSPEGETP